METKSDKERQTRRLKWEELDFSEQLVYIRQAEYLIEKGYMTDDPFVIAKTLYDKRKK